MFSDSDPNPEVWLQRQAARFKMADAAARSVAGNAAWLVIDNPLCNAMGYDDGSCKLAGCSRTLQVNNLRRSKTGGGGASPSVTLHTDVPIKRWDCTVDSAGRLTEVVVRVSLGSQNVSYDLLAQFNGLRQVLRPVRLSGRLDLDPLPGSPGLRVTLDKETKDVLLVDGRYTVNSNDGPLRLQRVRLRLSPRAATQVTANGKTLASIAALEHQRLRWSYKSGDLYPDFAAADEVVALEGVTDDQGVPTLHQAAPDGMPDADLSLKYIGRAAGVSHGKFSQAHPMANRTSDDPAELDPIIVITSPTECLALPLDDWDDREKCGYVRIPVV